MPYFETIEIRLVIFNHSENDYELTTILTLHEDLCRFR